MSAQGLTSRGRLRAEALMVDACVIKRATGTMTNPITGVVSPTYTTVYTGKCKIQAQAIMFPSLPDAGEHRFTVGPTSIHVPIATTGVRVGDLAEITASFDDANVGRTLRITLADRKTFQTAMRLLAEEVAA